MHSTKRYIAGLLVISLEFFHLQGANAIVLQRKNDAGKVREKCAAISKSSDTEKARKAVDAMTVEEDPANDKIGISGSGSLSAGEDAPSFVFRFDSEACTLEVHEMSASEVEAAKEKLKLPKSSKSSNTPAEPKASVDIKSKGKGVNRVNGAAGYGYRGAQVVMYDPLVIPLNQTERRLWWYWENNGTTNSNGNSGYCFAYNPTALNTHWYTDSCGMYGPYHFSNGTVAGVNSQYHNDDFAGCLGQRAYNSVSLSVTGQAWGNSTWNWSVYRWGASCAYVTFGYLFLV
jgi:hypothetical protein